MSEHTIQAPADTVAEPTVDQGAVTALQADMKTGHEQVFKELGAGKDHLVMQADGSLATGSEVAHAMAHGQEKSVGGTPR